MSSEIYELMKRPDERYVVERAHRRPRFVEDSVREMVRGTLERLPDLPDEAFLHARQVNFETIHAHDVEAERSGTLAEIRAELAGGPRLPHHTTLAEWLIGRG
jgi:GTP cyclohydrolase I/GTP cyclohydrolase-4